MKPRLRRSTVIPLILLAYLAIMSTFGYRQYSAGQTSATYFYGIIALSLLTILLLHLNLKKREHPRTKKNNTKPQKQEQTNNKTT